MKSIFLGGHFSEKNTEIFQSNFAAISLQTHPLGEILKIYLTGHLKKKNTRKIRSRRNLFFFKPFFKKISGIFQLFIQAVFLQTHPLGDFFFECSQKVREGLVTLAAGVKPPLPLFAVIKKKNHLEDQFVKK